MKPHKASLPENCFNVLANLPVDFKNRVIHEDDATVIPTVRRGGWGRNANPSD